MISQSQIVQINDFLIKSQNILVLIGSNAELDVLAASSALFLSLEQSGKDVAFASPSLTTNVNKNLVGLDNMRAEISNKNLVVGFDYDESAVEKVSYHIGDETNRFYLTVKPKKGHKPLDKDSIEVNYVGAEADLIFMIGVHSYESLEHLYVGNEQFFTDTTVVAINNFEAQVGDIRLDTSKKINISSAVTEIIRQANLSITDDASTNLLFSIEETTDSFRSLSTTPDLLEEAAWLMRNGARRIRRSKASSHANKVGAEVKNSEVEVEKK